METALINSEVAEAPERDSDAAVFHRRIEFHLARKPFNGFVSSNTSSNGFKLVTLNPNSDTRKTNGSVNKYEKPELVDSGLDPELSLEITFRRIGAGLRNLGNTCFLNSVLQCLTYTEPLAAYLQSGKHQNSCRTAGFCALCAIQKHVSRALQSTGRILEPKDLVSNLRCISRTFRNARQEDAHEYMVNLLESMHKCCLPTGVPSESASAYEKSLVHKIFGGRLRSQVKCMQCSFCSNKFDPFLDLSLEIQKADTVQKALSHFTAKEQLDGGAKQYQCQQCKQKVRAVKQLTIHKAPHVLTVHLKRFGSHVPGQKIDKRIAFGPTLDLKPFVTGPYDGDLNYTLYGVLVHAGWSTHSGHYYCFIRTSSGMWYSLDDNQVVQVSEKKVMEQKAYMLFYVKDRRKSGTKKPVDIVSSTKKPVDIVSSTKKPVDIVQKENMVMNAIGNAAAYSKFNLEIKEKIQNGRVEKSLEGSLTNKPKEIPSIKVSVQNVNGKMTVEHSSIVPTKNSNKEHYHSEMSESKTMPTATIGEPSNKINDVKPSKQNNIEESEVGESSRKNGNSITEESNEKKEKLDSVEPKHLSHEIAKKKRPQLKVNKKIFKRQVATMSLSSSIIFGVANMRKKKHKLKKHHSMHKKSSSLENPSNENDLPSVSDKSVPLPVNNFAPSQKKKAKHGSEDKSQNLSSQNVNGNISTSSEVTDKEFRKRIVLDGTTHSAPDIRKSAVGNSEEQKMESKQNDVMSMLTRGLEETTVARWDGIDVSRSEKSEQRAAGTTQIGYIGDEWDEEYDKGKRKKIRESKIPFGGPNLFQELATRNTKRKRAKLERFENQPVRI